MPSWDAATYLRYADERARPFADLVARVGATAPSSVVDLGCGTAELTARLGRRWPSAHVVGVDSSPAMVAEAARYAGDRLEVVQGDVRSWEPAGSVDVVVTNAVLQWVPDHEALLRRWVGWLSPGGWLALQVPASFDEPSHVLLREVAAREPFAEHLAGVLRADPVLDLDGYAEVLHGGGCAVDAWGTAYRHVLDPAGEHGPDAVLAWMRGTGLRPVLDALEGQPVLRERFVDEYGAALRAAYPRRPYGTPLLFRRLFAVARRP